MFRPLAVNIGLRYAGSKRSFISFVGALALAGLSLSVAVLVFVLAVVSGFERELDERILAVVPHIVARGYAPVEDFETTAEVIGGVDGVAGVAAVIEGGALLVGAQRAVGVNLVGIVADEYAAASRALRFAGADAAAALRSGSFGIVLGAAAAATLGVRPGDSLAAVLPDAAVTPLGLFPRRKRLTVAGILETGSGTRRAHSPSPSQLDQGLALMHRDDAARLFRRGGRVDGFHVRLERPAEAAQVRDRILGVIGAHRYWTRTWFESLGDLRTAIAATKGMLFLLLSLLVAVAAFNLVSSLVMVVGERRGDIAMLRTLGSTARLPVAAFVVFGALIAGGGVALGIAAGLVLGAAAEFGFPWLERALGTRLMGEYFIDTLPVAFRAGDIARVVATALALCLLATLLPAWRAARLRPADVLRHE